MASEALPSQFSLLSTRSYFAARTDHPSQVAYQLAEQLAECWKAGRRLSAEELLADHPGLEPDAVIQVICEEVCLRQEHGLEVNPSLLLKRFPQYRTQLRMLLDCHRLLQEGAAPVFPASGERLCEFVLEAELGRGALGRVFLARQADLAERLVVLKLAPRGGEEHLSLARLQHTHIVPLYQVVEDAERNLQALCMPYFGGICLDRLLAGLREQPLRQRSGASLLAALDHLAGPRSPSLSGRGAARAYLAQASFVEAICWLGAGLADALGYAHDRGLVHLDVKPSNVLVAADGQPMLLDFHLAIEPLQEGQSLPDAFGGTPGYMSPEQIRVLSSLKNGELIRESVGPQSDIFSLGVLLYECLSGRMPTKAARGLRQCNPNVSAGLADVIGRCLNPAAGERYPHASVLAADLRRHLANLPLQGVGNRSLVERWQKWRRRRPLALTVGLLLLSVLAVAAGGGLFYLDQQRRQLRQAEHALVDGLELSKQGAHAEAVRALTRGLEMAQHLGQGELAARIQSAQQAAHLARRRQDLHSLAERIRFLFVADALPDADRKQFAESCGQVWASRGLLLAGSTSPQVRQDLLDLVIFWTDLYAQDDTTRQKALDILTEAERELQPTRVLFHERQRHAKALGLTELAAESARQAEQLPLQSAWDHYALGRALFLSGQWGGAEKHFQQAVDIYPDGFWPNFYQGVCCHRQGKYGDAVAAFRVCISLAPGQAQCYFNRAQAWQALGQPTSACQDYDRALQLDRGLAAAWLNRGILHLSGKRNGLAIQDLEQALRQGGDRGLVHFNLALAHHAEGNRAKALAHLQQSLSHRPRFQPARELQARLQIDGN